MRTARWLAVTLCCPLLLACKEAPDGQHSGPASATTHVVRAATDSTKAPELRPSSPVDDAGPSTIAAPQTSVPKPGGSADAAPESTGATSITGCTGANCVKVKQVAAGDRHTCALLEGGTVRCWGLNDSGQLGNGTKQSAAVPTAVPGLQSVAAIAARGGQSCALLGDGSVKCWGDIRAGKSDDDARMRLLYPDVYARMKHEDAGTTERTSPTLIAGVTGATAISAGESHACALMADHTVRCWGGNDRGQLGDGTKGRSMSAVAVSKLANARSIAAGGSFTCALLADSTVTCWGGRLGADGESLTPLPVRGLGDVAAVAAGDSHACAVLSDGRVKCWGSQLSNTLGNGQLKGEAPTPEEVRDVKGATAIAASDHTCAVVSGGEVACWGWCTNGALGRKDNAQDPAPGRVFQVQSATAVATGGVHSCALLSSGDVVCWGNNREGELGRGHAADTALPPGAVTF